MIVGKTLEEWIEIYKAIELEPNQDKRVIDYYFAKVQGLKGITEEGGSTYFQIGYQDGLIDRELMQGE